MSPIESSMVFISIVVVGYLGKVYGVITDEGKKHLTKVLFYILLPALVASGVMKAPLDADTMYVFLASVVITSILWYFFWRIFGFFYDRKTASLLAMAVTIGNTGFLGFPLTFRMLGGSAMPYAVSFSIGQSIVLLTLIYPSLGGRFQWRRLLSPPLVGMLVGFAIKLIPFMPQVVWNVILDFLSMLGSASGPLVMLIIGASLGGITLKPYDAVVVSIKTFLVPLIFYFSLMPFVGDLPLKAATLEASTPTLMGAPIYAAMAGLSEEETSRIVTVSTAFFLILLPAIGLILGG